MCDLFQRCFAFHSNIWDRSKLHSIQNKVNTPYNISLKRCDQVIISRTRIGHSKLTHTYLLQGEKQPGCIFCDCPLTVYHIFWDCLYLFPARRVLFTNVQSMQGLFTKVNINDIMQFWQECDFYNKLHLVIAISYIYLLFLCPSDGTLNCSQCQGWQRLRHAKDRYTGFWRSVSSWGPPGKLQNFRTDKL